MQETRDERQKKCADWVRAAFGDDQAGDVALRALRCLEEAIEAYQSAGGSLVKAHMLVDYVFSRPVGELKQELGGMSTTFLALAAAVGCSADEVERAELERVLSKPLEYFKQRNLLKCNAGFR